MKEKDKKSASRFMSLILRHEPERIGIALDKNGWADTNELLVGLNRNGYDVGLKELKEIVASNDKQRFKFNEDNTKIRANQGHSVAVEVKMEELEPPVVLYHGTATRFLGAIKKGGLISKNRLHVHLSDDKETALKVGARHGKSVILTINSHKMYEDGFKFYLSDNGVWLTDVVPVKYIWQF